MSCVTCHMSHVTCHLSHVMCDNVLKLFVGGSLAKRISDEGWNKYSQLGEAIKIKKKQIIIIRNVYLSSYQKQEVRRGNAVLGFALS